ncbi:MAG TPA: hypothetical protein VK306_02730 [Acidimicrobiales bacterium]|nr:hypothetical protein [Acidimicrobiales bacterium]
MEPGHARPRPRGALVGAALLALAGVAAAGCGDDDDNGGETTAGADAAAADAVCTLLRGWNDDYGEVLNATSQTITDEDDPATATDVLVGGFDELIAIGEDHVTEVDELDLPAIAERDALLDELRAGAERSIAVLREEREEAAALGPIEVADQRGALGGAFTGVERATSVFEPRIAAYGDDLQRAFAADPGCAHVVQPTGD